MSPHPSRFLALPFAGLTLLPPGPAWLTALALQYLLRRKDLSKSPEHEALGYYTPVAGVALAVSLTQSWQVAAGVVAAQYLLAGIAKMRVPGWAHPDHHALLVAERASGPFRRWASRSRPLMALVGYGGLATELGAGLYVWPAARWPVTVAILALHTGIGVLLGYIHPTWMLLIFGVTLQSL